MQPQARRCMQRSVVATLNWQRLVLQVFAVTERQDAAHREALLRDLVRGACDGAELAHFVLLLAVQPRHLAAQGFVTAPCANPGTRVWRLSAACSGMQLRPGLKATNNVLLPFACMHAHMSCSSSKDSLRFACAQSPEVCITPLFAQGPGQSLGSFFQIVVLGLLSNSPCSFLPSMPARPATSFSRL